MTSSDPLLEMLEGLVRGGMAVSEARRLMINSNIESDAVNNAVVQYHEMVRGYMGVGEAGSIDNTDLSPWYPGPSAGDTFWPALRGCLLQKGWDTNVIQSIDDQSTRVVARLSSPGQQEINTRGLVLGYVQSGKTANFSAVIAKSADSGYRLFIILSGLTNALRAQTQTRLEGDVVNPTRPYWVLLTSEEKDFDAGALGNINAFLADHHDDKVLCVVKKNATILRRLLTWLHSASEDLLYNIPVLVIDDEADQASVNTGQSEEERSTISRLILQIINELPKAAYVGYTATPFANVFIDPSLQDLYPADFILSLPIPDNYFGPEAVFGRERISADEPAYDGLDMIRRVSEEDAECLKPGSAAQRHEFEPQMTPSLEQALSYFWLSAAARYARGQENEPTTMLIHTTMFVVVHDLLARLIMEHQNRFLQNVRQANEMVFEDLRNLWNSEKNRASTDDPTEESISFDRLLLHFLQVIQNTIIVVENAQSEQRLNYSEPVIQIVIGGNVLTRGLTLEGLIVSYFVRTANAYDTLLQMGRWFGYRSGYGDLPRIWMTAELENYFFDLATVEQEVRNDIRRYELEGITPLQFGPRIRTHPSLSITSRMKMQSAVQTEVSYSDRRLQTILFKHKDRHWLLQNLDAARRLIQQCIAIDIQVEQGNYNNFIYRNVPVRIVVGFFEQYQFHENSVDLRSQLIQDYIHDQNQEDALQRWSVVIAGKAGDSESEMLDITSDLRVPLLTRSRLRIGSSDYASLGTIMSKEDRVADLNIDRPEISAVDDVELQAMRPEGIGLLILYPISRRSAPRNLSSAGISRREPLDAVEHVIGVGLVFPRARHLTPQTYMTVDLSGIPREEIEWPEEENEE